MSNMLYNRNYSSCITYCKQEKIKLIKYKIQTVRTSVSLMINPICSGGWARFAK